jgi:hypothetical protein
MDATTSNLRWVRYGTLLAGVGVLVIVAGMYARAFAGGPWPPKHPYIGLTLLICASQACGSPFLISPVAVRMQAVSAALALLTGVLWLALAWAG